MPKRHRVRARARRPVETHPQRAERGTARPGAPAPDRERPERARGRYRGAPLPPGGAYAIGAPSPTLERAAALERTNVVKDLRRLGIVAAVTLALLFATGLVLSTVVR